MTRCEDHRSEELSAVAAADCQTVTGRGYSQLHATRLFNEIAEIDCIEAHSCETAK